ncbi:putative lactoylglutathione lyase [Catenulispora sp. MAP12-49]|uniref:glyoxalase n=1 Tax=Catenulispora sp. MAP12-49 TaxID=3156302 RepID=UPI0035170BC9
MPVIESVILESPEPEATEAFYAAAFGLDDRLRVRATEAPTTGFRGYLLSLVVSQPGNADLLTAAALEHGAKVLQPAKKSFWGYGGIIQAPDGAIWKISTSEKKDSAPATRAIDAFVLLLGVTDVKTTKQFYVDRGLTVAKSFGSKYVEFDTAPSPVKLAMYTRRAAAKDAGIDPEGTGSRRLAITAGGDRSFTDPDGLGWEAVRAAC